jgi:hypothetical protein
VKDVLGPALSRSISLDVLPSLKVVRCFLERFSREAGAIVARLPGTSDQ